MSLSSWFSLASLRPNAQDEEGRTLLYLAAEEGSIRKVRYAIEKGCDPNIPEEKGRTPLHAAAWWGETHIVEELLKNGADINAETKKGWTALHAAIANGRRDTFEFLVNAGADLHKKDSLGWTPLHYLELWNHRDEFDRLQEYIRDMVDEDETAKPSDLKTMQVEKPEIDDKAMEEDIKANNAPGSALKEYLEEQALNVDEDQADKTGSNASNDNKSDEGGAERAQDIEPSDDDSAPVNDNQDKSPDISDLPVVKDEAKTAIVEKYRPPKPPTP